MKLYIINKILIVKDVSPNLKRYIMLENSEKINFTTLVADLKNLNDQYNMESPIKT